MKPPRIAILLDKLRFGGAERALVSLSRGFSDQGYHVDFLVQNINSSAYLDNLKRYSHIKQLDTSGRLGVRFYIASKVPSTIRLSPDLYLKRKALPTGMRILPSLVAYLEEKRPSALLTTMPKNNILALWARQIAGTPTRVVIREANSFSHAFQATDRRSKAIMMRLAAVWYVKADAIVAVCDGVADDLAQSLRIARRNISTIYNPVDVEQIEKLSQSPSPHPWLMDNEQPVLVTVGRLNAQKDHRTLLQSLAILNRKHPTRLIIVGEGGLKGELQAEIARLSLDHQVHWAGTTDNPFAYIGRADALVLSSAWEGLPNVLLEALACRTPIVSTDAAGGGPAELLRRGRYGHLTPIGNAQKLAEGIEAALAEPGDLEAGYRRAQEFTMERAVKQYLTLMLENG